jgi:hypothetical protein
MREKTLPFFDDVSDREPVAPSEEATCELTDAQRLAVLAELWAETVAGPKHVPLYVAAQRYEQRVRESLRQSLRGRTRG